MSDLPPATNVRTWLESLVGCDCDNGWRPKSEAVIDGPNIPPVACGRCVLVEVGGIRVRVDQKRVVGYEKIEGVVLPAVGVADE